MLSESVWLITLFWVLNKKYVFLIVSNHNAFLDRLISEENTMQCFYRCFCVSEAHLWCCLRLETEPMLHYDTCSSGILIIWSSTEVMSFFNSWFSCFKRMSSSLWLLFSMVFSWSSPAKKWNVLTTTSWIQHEYIHMNTI